MRRRYFLLGTASVASIAMPRWGRTATPCPPPQVSVAGGTTATTTCGSTGQGHSYTTQFPDAEDPISQGGVWSNVGLDWTYVKTVPGFACGTNKGIDYDDSYAHLSGFGPDQTVEVVLRVAPNLPNDGNSREVELHLRWNDAPHSATGYEIDLSYLGGIEIVRWNGAAGDFTVTSGAGSTPVPTTGDVVKASIVGSLITVYYNNVVVCTLNDTTFATGNPGMGFFIRPGANNSDFGVTSYTATSTT
jgi:hypothetical protein